jgi:protein-disulfide isomerase
MTAFNTCFKANKYKAEIQADFDGGNKLGVQGTPSVFVNGTFITPGFIPSYDDVLKAVEAASTK